MPLNYPPIYQTISGNTAGVPALILTGTLTLAGGPNITLSQAGNAISVSGPAAGLPSADSTKFVQANAAFAGTSASGTIASNGISVSIGPYLTTAMASNRGSDFVQANAVFAGTSASGTIASNGISVSIGPYLTTAAASNHSHGNPTLALTNLSGTTASNSGGLTLSLSAANPGAGGGIAAAAGTQTAETGTVMFSNSNNVTFGMTNSSIVTASASFAQSVQTQNFVAVIGSGANGNGTFTSGTLSLKAGDGITLSTGANVLSFHAATNFLTTAALSNHSHGNPTLALTNLTGTTASASNGLTLSLSAAAPGAAAVINRQYHEIMDGENLVAACSITGASFSKRPIFVPFWLDGEGLSCKSVEFYGSRPAGTSLNMTYGIGFYSMSNSTRIDLVSSTTNAVSLTASGQFSSVRRYQITGLSNLELTEGRWIAALFFSGSNNSTAVQNLILYGGQTMIPVNGYVFPGTDSTGATSGSVHVVPFWGVYASTTGAFPASVHRSEISGHGSNNVNADIYMVVKEI